ncbi:MAG: hypothetical protein HY016_08655 [Nitrosomonadales bacterium]|nr:hypothetical protein [Nitrosomonadales bacterium]
MKNETSSDTSILEAEVRKVVEEGHDIQENIRKLTLNIIRSRSFDIQSLQQTATAVLRGAQAGVQHELQKTSAQTHIARDHLKQAVTGLDVALAQFAEAAKLAVEEAASRAQKYSNEDLKLARADLASLEAMFLGTLQSAASATKDAAGDILRDLTAHTRTHGSAVGAQMKETLAVFTHQLGATGRAQVGVGMHLAKNTSDLLRQIAAGVLTGLADHVRPGHSKGPGGVSEDQGK